MGKIFEDIDLLATDIAYKHCDNEEDKLTTRELESK